MKYRFIETHRSEFTVKKMCHVLEVSRSGYSTWRNRLPAPRTLARERLKTVIREQYIQEHSGMAGSPTITADLKADGVLVNRTRVAALMREMGLQCRTQKRWVKTTDSSHSLPIAPNYLNRQFQVQAPNMVWVSDITYLAVNGKWMYLCVFIDLFARRVVGWHLAETMHVELIMVAFKRAIAWRRPTQYLLVHSDRGVQYAAHSYRALLAGVGAVQSMSRKGDCWDNAVAESFFHSLKSRLTSHARYRSREQLERDLFIYIEGYYNRRRKHSTNGWETPEQHEANFHKMTA